MDEHDHSVALEENMIPLAPPGADSPLIDIDFYPDWSDAMSSMCYNNRGCYGSNTSLSVCKPMQTNTLRLMFVMYRLLIKAAQNAEL